VTRRRLRHVVLPAAALAAVIFVAGSVRFLDGPPAAHTGGFGEPTCAACHFDVAQPDPNGSLRVSGLPTEISPGTRYLLDVELRRPGMRAGGFQLSARFAEGEAKGRQAGSLRPVDDRVSFTEHRGVQYVQQTSVGTDAAGGAARWRVEWTAPSRIEGPISFDAAGNAADGDESQLGDHVYTASERRRAEPR
jgi:hypothetical protein